MSFDFKIFNGDIAIGKDGDLQKVQDTEKLIQEILKIAITPLGSNTFYPWYGSPISKSLVGNTLSMSFVSSMASSQLRNSLETLQKLQKIQAESQAVSPFEQLAAIQESRVERNVVDPRFFTVIIKVLTRALTTADTQFSINSL